MPFRANGDLARCAGEEGQEPGHGRRFRQPGPDLPALAEAFPDDPIIAEEDASELRRAGNAAILDQVLRHVRHVRAEQGDALDADEVCRWIDRGGTSGYRDRFWTLDPIDGTKGFLRGEQYAVALALVVDGQVAVAALACPQLVAGDGWRVVGEEEHSRMVAGGGWRVAGGGGSHPDRLGVDLLRRERTGRRSRG